MTHSKFNKRNTFAWTVNLTLIVLTIVISVAGYKAYQRLNNMVSELQQSAEPNYNLLILKEISYFVNEMEREIDAYRNNPNPESIRSFNESLDQSQYLIDSLKSQYTTTQLNQLCDSLSNQIKERAKVQTKLRAINSDLLESTLEDLTQKIEDMPRYLAEADTVEEEVTRKILGIIRIGKKKKKDTVEAPSQSEVLQSEIMSELAKAKEESEEKGSELRYQLSALESESRVFQSRIINLINTLETHELMEGRNHVKSVQSLANDTNREVVIFSALSSALLLITLISQLNYVGRNKRYQSVLREAKQNAEELAEAKEKFLANMSHEIRTPMNAISGFTNQLLKSTKNDEQREQLQIIKSSSDHLLHLLNDILDFSKLQAERVTLDSAPFDIKSLLHETIRLFEDSAEEKNLTLTTELDAIPQFVLGDEHRLRQILINLLHNAIKFTDAGFVKLSAGVQLQSGDNVTLKITVKDTGVGIPKEKQTRIFEEFEQVNTSDQTKGTGLGLAISSMLVKLHNGEFLIKSEPGKGTEMILLLPYKISQPKEMPVNAKKQSGVRLSGISILVADDEPFNLKLLETIFKGHDVELVQTKDGNEALAALLSQSFDIAILDVKMPKLNGWEVVQKIRKTDSKNSQIPMMALTATVSNQEMEESLEAGFDSIMRKPFDEEEFLELILSETQKSKKKEEEEAPAPQEKEQEKPQFDLTGLQEMGDDDFVNEMIAIFKSSSARSIENLKKAVKLKIRDGIRNEAHKMLPPARHLSAMELVKELEKLQNKANTESFDALSIRIQRIEAIYQSIKDSLQS